MTELTEKEKVDIAKTNAETKDIVATRRIEARRVKVDERRIALDEKRLYLDTVKVLCELLGDVTVDDSATSIGSDTKFKCVLTPEEQKKCKDNIDYYLKKII